MQEVRNFVDFKNKKFFPGFINDNNGEYEFPTLYHIDSNNKTRMWKISIRLVKGNKKKYVIDWDKLIDNTIPVKSEYLDKQPIPEFINVQYYVETGVIDGKIVRHPPTYTVYKNKGKKNERNPFEQALVDARTKYLKKIESGFVIDLKVMITSYLFHPMLVHNFKTKQKNIKYPAYIQPKLDGTRCIAFLNTKDIDKSTYKDVMMYTRQLKEYQGFDEIKKILFEPLLKLHKEGGLYIDGELYSHGDDLQTICGAVRNPNRDNIEKYKNIQYWIYDLFYPNYLDITFEDRLPIIDKVFDIIKKNNYIVKTPTHYVGSLLDINTLYHKYLREKYEGIIIRNSNSLYLTSSIGTSAKLRSKYILKRKEKYSNEYELVDFKQGIKGRDVGAILWILKTYDNDKTEHLFTATPKNMTYDERYKLYKKLKSTDIFEKEYKNRMMTIEYEDLSEFNIPLRAKSVGFREHV